MTNNQEPRSNSHGWTLILALGLAFAGCDKFSQQTPQQHVDKAKEYLDAGDLKKGSCLLYTSDAADE